MLKSRSRLKLGSESKSKSFGIPLKIHYMSDLHLDRDETGNDLKNFNIEKTDANIIIIAGDTVDGLMGVSFAYQQSHLLKKPVVYIFGNHEYHFENFDTLIPRARKLELTLKQKYPLAKVFILDNQELYIKDANIRILGTTMWSDVDTSSEAIRGKIGDYKKVKMFNENLEEINLTPEVIKQTHQDNVQWLKKKLKEKTCARHTIIVTHHSPHPVFSKQDFEDPVTTAYSTDLSKFFKKNLTWIFGHTHFVANTIINGTRLVSNPRGYPREYNEVPFNPVKTITV